MKHFGYSKFIVAAIMLLLASCTKHDEISFKGVVIDVRQCTMMSSGQLPVAGYFVHLETPDSIGGSYTLNNNQTYNNVVVLYEPDCRIYRDDHIRGSFYLDNDYSHANCAYHWTDIQLPEGVFTTVSVD